MSQKKQLAAVGNRLRRQALTTAGAVYQRMRRHRPAPRKGSKFLEIEANQQRVKLTGAGAPSMPVALVAVRGTNVLARFPVNPAPTSGAFPVTNGTHAYQAEVDYQAVLDAAATLDAEASDTDDSTFTAEDGELAEITAPGDEDESDEGWSTRLGWVFRGEGPTQPIGTSFVIRDEVTVKAAKREARSGEYFNPDALGSEWEPLSEHEEWIQWAGRSAEIQRQGLNTYEVGEHEVTPLITTRGNVRIDVDTPTPVHAVVFADDVVVTSQGVRVQGRINSVIGKLEPARFVLIARETRQRFAGEVTLVEDQEWTSKDFGRRAYTYNVQVPIPYEDWEGILNSDRYDAWIEFPQARDDGAFYRVNKVPFLTRRTALQGILHHQDKLVSVTPYFTFKAKALSFIIEHLDRAVEPYLTGQRAVKQDPNVWLIGEQPHRAGDNGLHFFTWMRQNHPEVDAYYVINESSPDVRNFQSLDHVVFTGSPEHFRLSLAASQFVGSHHPDYLFPIRAPHFVDRLKGARTFLQHGVMGTKWMVPNYGRRAVGFDVDRVFVSSELERQILIKDFEYRSNQVRVTGLPRFDTLLGGHPGPNRGQVIVMPSWRDWLSTDEALLESDYFAEWRGLLSSPQFQKIVQDHQLHVKFYLHNNMQRFASMFEDLPVTLVRQGDQGVQELMQESELMITDYSSVGFDFSFQHRPVIYFQFDRERFLGRWGSHLDLDQQLPGAIGLDRESVLAELEGLAEQGLQQTPEMRRRADLFLDYRDTKNNQRVYEAICAGHSTTTVSETGEWSRAGHIIKRRLRKNKYYFTVMRGMYRVLSVMPKRRSKRPLVFEAGLGRQYADSPRYLYEELVRRGDTRPKVWVYRGPHKFTDETTRVVERLSPEYYQALAQARIWTMNQSAPSYLKRPRRARFVQTWHGTPLKHMQWDMADLQNRGKGYLARAQAGVRQWTHLLSPSPYATDAFRSAFRYEGPVVELGYPRNDPLKSSEAEQLREKVRADLGLESEQQAVLYAPTFRDNQAKARGRFRFELPFDLEEFAAQTPENIVLLLRMHVLVANKIQIPDHLAHRVKDVSKYAEIQELYLGSDALVTDYSSVFFDAAVLRKPIVFFAYDLEDYRDNLRGFYLDYQKDLPGPIVEDADQLWPVVMQGLQEGIDQDRRTAFLERFAPRDDGHASQRVVDELY